MFLCHEKVLQINMYPIYIYIFFRISGFFDGCISRQGAIRF